MFAEVPFRLAGGDNPLILIPVRVNGRGPFDFILDTGAGTSLLSPRLAADLGVVTTGTKEGAGAAGKVQVALGSVESLAVAGARREPMPIAITAEIDRIGAAVGARIDGDLGYDFLRDYRLGIDYGRETVRLAQGAYEAAGAGALGRSEIAFQLAAPRKPLIVVPVHVNGRGPYDFALDTGASMTTVSPALAAELAIASEEPVRMTGGGGVLEASTGRIASLAVGTAALPDLGVTISDFLGPLGEAVGRRLDGVIGHNFLRWFRVTIDYPNGQLCLVRAA